MSSQPPYRLLQTSQFKRAFVKFARRHPELRNATEETLASLKADPFNPSLRLHNLSGRLKGKQAVSITYAYRIVLCVEIVEHEIILHNIGSHDEVYGSARWLGTFVRENKWAIELLFVGLSVLNYWLAYRLFCRRQMIGKLFIY